MATHCSQCNNGNINGGNGRAELILPCRHILCLSCINGQIDALSRTYCLRCPQCDSKFALAHSRDPLCEKSPVTHMLPNFVADKYLENLRRHRCIKDPRRPKIMGLAVSRPANKVFAVAEKQMLTSYTIPNNANDEMQHTSRGVSGLKWPRGIAVGELYNSIYIIDWVTIFGGKLWTYRHENGGVVSYDFDVQPFGIAVLEINPYVEIFVTCATPLTGKQQQIIVFTDDGRSVVESRRLVLPSSFQIPRHAVPLRRGNDRHSPVSFAVCHGWTSWKNHCVSLVRQVGDSNNLEEVAVYGTAGGNGPQQLRRPLSLCVDEDGMIFVVDYFNHRIHLLTPELQLVRHLLMDVQYPRQVCLSPSGELLIVGFEDGSIISYKVREARQ